MLQNWKVSVNYAAAVMDIDALALNCKMFGTFVTKLQRQLSVQETRTKNCIISMQELFAIPGIYCELHRMKTYALIKYNSVIIEYIHLCTIILLTVYHVWLVTLVTFLHKDNFSLIRFKMC